jgi:hypothetical protein
MLGFDALGRLALGQARAAPTTLAASVGSFSVTGIAASLTISQASGAGAYALSGVGTPLRASMSAQTGVGSMIGVTASFNLAELSAVGSYGLGAVKFFVQTPAGLDALGRLAIGQMSNAVPISGVAVSIKMPAAGSALAITPGPLNALLRTGADFDLVYGGIGHYLEELERARQLAKITRKTPAPIVQQSGPALRPAPSASIAPMATASLPPAIDLQAIAAQRMAQQQAQAEQARTLKRRRQQLEILLLAS